MLRIEDILMSIVEPPEFISVNHTQILLRWKYSNEQEGFRSLAKVFKEYPRLEEKRYAIERRISLLKKPYEDEDVVLKRIPFTP